MTDTDTDAGRVLDGVRSLRKLMTALDDASFALSNLAEDELAGRLTDNANDVLSILERLERSSVYKQLRKEHLNGT